jgi:hypothetical protein
MLAALILISSAHAQNYSTKTPYPEGGFDTIDQIKGYTPVFINHVGRHGSRYQSKPKNDEEFLSLSKRYSFKKNNSLGDTVSNVSTFIDKKSDKYGQLSTLGITEHKSIGKRMKGNFKDLFGPKKRIIAYATFKKRAQDSRKAFLDKKGLGHSALQINFCEGKDPILRFFNLCTKYKEYFKKYKDWEAYTWNKKKECFDNPAKCWGKAIFENHEDVPPEHRFFASKHLYELISINRISGSNIVIGKDFTSNNDVINYFGGLSDLEAFYGKGPGAEGLNRFVYFQAFPLLCEFLRTSEKAISQGKQGNTVAILRFAHAETIIPFAALLGIEGASKEESTPESVKWKAAEISPMAANIQWIVYEKDKAYFIRIMLNEKTKKIYGENGKSKEYDEKAGLYKWETLKTIFIEKMKSKEIFNTDEVNTFNFDKIDEKFMDNAVYNDLIEEYKDMLPYLKSHF